MRYILRFKKFEAPYWFMITTWIPLFLIVLFFSESDRSHYQSLNYLIGKSIFSGVGFWSSNFPLISSIIVNYVCFTAPIFAILFCYLTLKKSTLEKKSLDSSSRVKIFFYVIGFTFVIGFFLYIMYIGSTDLASSRKLSIIGKYEILYALYSAGMMFLFYMFFLVGYLVYGFFPRALINQRKNKI